VQIQQPDDARQQPEQSSALAHAKTIGFYLLLSQAA
jgi:hypothetical protein